MARRPFGAAGAAQSDVSAGGIALAPAVAADAADTSLMPRAVAALSPWVMGGAWALVLLLVALYPLAPRFLTQYQFVPFLFGMVFLGLPHGAMDHLVVPWERRRRLTLGFFVLFCIGYLGLTVLYLGLWRALPGVALAGFLLLSWLHWGQGDAWALHTFLGRPLPTARWRAALIWAVRGALPIILSPLAFPQVFGAFAQGILAWYAPGQTPWYLSPAVRLTGFLALGALFTAYAAAAWGEYGPRNRRAFWIDMGEVALLTLLFTHVPPVLAVGVYFCVWHAWRHIARLMLLDPKSLPWLASGHMGKSVARMAWLSLPLTLAALAMLGGLYAVQAHRNIDASGLVYLYLSLVAALTFPHFLLVIWMDRQAPVRAV